MTKKNATVVTTTTPASPARRRTATDIQAVQTSLVAMLGQTWRALSPTEKDSWVGAAQQLHNARSSGTEVNLQPTVNPYQTFVSANTAIYTITGTVLRQSPPVPVIAGPVPPCMINAVYTPATGLHVTLLTAAYPSHVLIYGAPLVPAGQNIYKKKGALKLLGGLQSLSGTNDISALYNARFRCSAPGSKIALKIVGVSPSGTRTAELFVSGIVASAAAASSGDTTDQTKLKVA